MNEWESSLVLALSVEPGDVRVNRILVDYTPEEVVRRASAFSIDTAPALAGLSSQLESMKKLNARFVTSKDAEWPRALNDLGLLTPIGVWMRGRIDIVKLPAVAMVGARSCSIYGQDVAMTIAGGLASCDCAVVSGGALGIDAAAHRGALVVNGATIAVLAGGLDEPYPRANSQLFDTIAEQGLLLSESPLGTPPLKHRFLIRNRLIAALGRVTVVVEARLRSGAQSTASHATAIGRDVAAVPGLVTSASSVGCHALIRDGAILVTSAEDVYELMT